MTTLSLCTLFACIGFALGYAVAWAAPGLSVAWRVLSFAWSLPRVNSKVQRVAELVVAHSAIAKHRHEMLRRIDAAEKEMT